MAGRFVPTPALTMVAPRVKPQPWPVGEARLAKCFALRGHEAPFPDCACGLSAYYELDEEPDQPAPDACGARSSPGAASSSARPAFAPSSRGRSRCSTPTTATTSRIRAARAAAAAEAYGIPVLARDELIAYAGWYGELREAA